MSVRNDEEQIQELTESRSSSIDIGQEASEDWRTSR